MSEKPPLHDPIADAFEGFRGDSLPAFVPPGADLVRGTVRRRKQARTAAAVACAAVILAGAGIAFASKGGPVDRLEPADPPTTTPTPGTSRSVSPTPTPSSTPSAHGPAASLAGTNWGDQAIPITGTDGCPGGTVTFENGAATVGGYTYRVLPAGAKAAFGDLDQDGADDAVISLHCGNGGELGSYLIGVGNANKASASPGTASASTAKPSLRALGTVRTENWGVAFKSYSVSGRDVVATVATILEDTERVQTRRYRWNGSQLVQRGGPASFPELKVELTADQYDWSTATLTLPFRGASTILEPTGRSCRKATVTLTSTSADGSQGAIQTADCEFWVSKVGTADLNGDGTPDALLSITATPRDNQATNDTGTRWYFGYTLRDGKPAPLGFVTAADLHGTEVGQPDAVTATSVTAGTRSVRVTQVFRSAGQPNQTLTRTFSWNGAGFSPSQAPPNPRADARP